MLTIPVAATRLQGSLENTEASIDRAVLDVTSLINDIVNARMAFRSHDAAKLAQPALLRAQKALQDVIEAQSEIARAHEQLLNAARITAGPAELEGCPDRNMGQLPRMAAA